jgi:hypothetical protein
MDAMIAVMNRAFAIEQAIETAALMLGTDNPRGYCLEMILPIFWREPTSTTAILRCDRKGLLTCHLFLAFCFVSNRCRY